MTIKNIKGLWVGIWNIFKIISKLCKTIKKICGLWLDISTIFKIISKLYNKGGGDDPKGIFLENQEYIGFMGGGLGHFQDNFRIVQRGGGDDHRDTFLT